MPRKPMPHKPIDPADAANQKVLADRAERIAHKQTTRVNAAVAADRLADELHLETPPAATAAEYLKDAWDKGVFGDQGELPTYKRLVYGPDPLLEANPGLADRIEKSGLESYAHATAEAILLKGEMAVPDPVLQRGLRGAIARYGAAKVAEAFRQRILQIPVREVEIEADRDDYILLQDPLRNAVVRYGHPGFAPKFMSDRSIALLGDRGYRPVRNEQGDVVKVGTLLYFEIPQHIANARRARAVAESEDAVAQQQDAYLDTQERLVSATRSLGLAALRPDELVHVDASDTEGLLGQVRPGGITIERQR